MNRVEKLFKSARRKAKISQEVLAEKLGYKSPQFVSNWERGLCCAPISNYVKIAALLSVPIVAVRNAKKKDFIEELDIMCGLYEGSGKNDKT